MQVTDRANKLSSSLSSLLPRVAHAHYVRIPRLSELRLQIQRSAQVSAVRCASIGSDLCWYRQRVPPVNGKNFFSLIISSLRLRTCTNLYELIIISKHQKIL